MRTEITREDYLRALYKAGAADEPVSNSILVVALDVSPASATEMLQRMETDGLINRRPYRGSTLTEKGLAAALDLTRAHRLWECFLISHLSYDPIAAHEDAHLLEHVTTPRLAEKLDQFLQHPETCPHGAPIPHTGSHSQEVQ